VLFRALTQGVASPAIGPNRGRLQRFLKTAGSVVSWWGYRATPVGSLKVASAAKAV